MQTNDSNPTRRVHNFGCTKSKALGGPGTPGSCWCDATPQPERFDEFTGGYDDVDHARAAKRINADLRAMDATPRGKHTPGPWEVRTDCGPSLYISERGKLSHANVWGRCEQSRETTIADARLIAAAPDLLEALQDILLDMAANESNGLTVKSARDWASVNRARTAIARATR